MDELQRQLKAFSKAYGLRGQMMEGRIKQLLAQGKSPKEAIEQVFKEFGVEDWLQASVSNVLVATAKDALGAGLAEQLSEAVLLEALSNPWDGSGMELSAKLHGASEAMKRTITETLQSQIRLNRTAKDTAQVLYDGYQHGNVIRQQELPKYMDDLLRWTRRSRENLTEEERRDLQRAIRKVRDQAEELVNDKSTYNHFRTALRNLVDKIDKGSEKSVQKAISVAIEEKAGTWLNGSHERKPPGHGMMLSLPVMGKMTAWWPTSGSWEAGTRQRTSATCTPMRICMAWGQGFSQKTRPR